MYWSHAYLCGDMQRPCLTHQGYKGIGRQKRVAAKPAPRCAIEKDAARVLGEAGGNGNRFILPIWKRDDLHEMQGYLNMRLVEMEDALGT